MFRYSTTISALAIAMTGAAALAGQLDLLVTSNQSDNILRYDRVRMSILEDLLDAIEDALEEAEGEDGVNGAAGPLSDPNKGYVSTRLDDTLTNIQHALSSEHLNDAGTADMSGLPSDLPGVAGWCHDKAVDAQNASSPVDKGSALKSARDAINQASGGYKDLAGIT